MIDVLQVEYNNLLDLFSLKRSSDGYKYWVMKDAELNSLIQVLIEARQYRTKFKLGVHTTWDVIGKE